MCGTLQSGISVATFHRNIRIQCSVSSFRSLSNDGSIVSSKRILQRVRSSASSSSYQYLLFSLRSSNSCLHLLPRLPVTLPSIIPSVTCFRRQLIRKMCPIQLSFTLFIVWRIFLSSLTTGNTASFLTWSVQLIFSIFLQHHIRKLSNCFWCFFFLEVSRFQHHTILNSKIY